MEEKIITESRIEGDLIFDGRLIIENGLYVTGSIKASFIFAKKWLSSGEGIEAGWGIEAGGGILSLTFEIIAKFIIVGRLPFWRKYWAEMKPLLPWREQILDESKCWADYRSMLTKDEAEEVCAWDGWHPVLRAQLEVFFGLKKKAMP